MRKLNYYTQEAGHDVPLYHETTEDQTQFSVE